jgi:UDP-glucose 4-epimerase
VDLTMILVTGGLGFIGLHTAEALLALGEDCVLTQFRSSRHPDFIAGEIDKRIFIEQLDVTNRDAFLALGEKYDISGIVHLAGTGSTPHDAVDDVHDNTAGLLNALRAASTWEVSRVTIASSIAVYAGIGTVPLQEDLPVKLTAGHPIEAFKKSGEVLATYIGARSGVEAVHLRIAGIWGPLYRSMNNLPSRLVHAAVKGETVDLSRGPIYAEDGNDLCDVRDCGRAIALLQVAERLEQRTFNVGAGRATRNKELVAAVRAVVPDFEMEVADGYNPNGPGVANYLDTTRIRQATGYEPAYDLQESVQHYVDWLRAGNDY